ncbi:hypothetical protein [Nitrococcus mobilis]|uniref:Uncharacterized protein n=1 Tax=Nitrococcus mobilis Nb-231 TaxID=314278 RepID=A4BTM0_9GAMM|nr:hypothetical protein [Nitrococcus mobilis]EAR20976.1 hypothetical protein NB231_00285 [Nitrococcus mobilis Nb-231]
MKRNVIRILVAGVVISSAFALIGCSPRNTTTTYQTQPTLAVAPSAECAGCGAITSIDRTGGVYDDSAYRVSIKLDNGGTQTLTQTTQPPFRVGDRVQILNQPVQ